jgi:hypothetical protein
MTDFQLLIDAARLAHLLCIAIGFGAAFLADFQIVRQLGRTVDDRMLQFLDLSHAVIWKILLGMWITGLILIQIRTQFVLENFSPKLASKLIAVAILTVNSALIGRIAMPLIRSARGQSLLDLPMGDKLTLATIGAISTASWLLAMAMGSSKVLAASDWGVFMVLLPVAYLAAIALAIGTFAGLTYCRQAALREANLPLVARSRRDRRLSAPIPVPAPLPANRRIGTALAAD